MTTWFTKRRIIIGGCLMLLSYVYVEYNHKPNTFDIGEKPLLNYDKGFQLLGNMGTELGINGQSSNRKKNVTEKNPIKTIKISKTLKEKRAILPLTLTGDYILNNPHLCFGTDKLIALVMVHTAPGHFERRQNIRSTYGSRDLFQNKVRVLFLLGTVKNTFLRDAIIQEHKTYKDTIQGNFTDSYHNLTHKGVMGFRWISEHCTNVKYVVKVDDDVVFDMWRFLSFFERRNGGNSILCPVVYHPKINRKGKWEVDQSEFKETRWPFEYCPGFVVILTGDVIAPLFKAARTTPFLWIDDVYLYGLLPYKAGNMRLYQMPSYMKVTPHEEGITCLINKRKTCEYLAVGIGYKESNFHIFWNLIKKRNGIE